MSDLKSLIRKALAGTSSQKPVDTKSLLRLGKSDEVMAALESLLASREINSAMVTRGATRTVQCWLTGATGLPPTAYLYQYPTTAMPPRYVECAGTTAPGRQRTDTSVHSIKNQPQQTKEQPMSTQKKGITGKASPITVAILELVGEQPGIGRKLLIELAVKRARGATEAQALKSIGNLMHISEKLRAEGGFGKRRYFLVGGAAKPAASSPAQPVAAKVQPKTSKAAAKPLPASKPASCAKSQLNDDPTFSILLCETGLIHVRAGAKTMVLDGRQAARLHRFIGRLNQFAGVPA